MSGVNADGRGVVGRELENQVSSEVPGDSRAVAADQESLARAPASTNIETIVSYVLRYGVLLSFLIILVGVVLLFVEGGKDASVQLGGVPIAQHPDAIVHDVLQLQPKAIIDLGLMLLIAIPVIHVAISILAFVVEEDFVYAGVTLFVLAVLLTSLFLGRGE